MKLNSTMWNETLFAPIQEWGLGVINLELLIGPHWVNDYGILESLGTIFGEELLA